MPKIECKKHGTVEARSLGDYQVMCSQCYVDMMKDKKLSSAFNATNENRPAKASASGVTRSPFG